MSKVETISYQGKDYATVPARLKEFREKNPRADITTEPRFLDDGSVVFQARITQDLKDEYSARATGTARYSSSEISKAKAFEKLETIAIGRALAVLGYLNNGEVATSEEMAEFEQYQLDKVESAIEAVKKAETKEQLADIQASLPAAEQAKLNVPIRERIKELQNATVASN